LSIQSTGIGHDELLGSGELESFKAGKSRKITVASIKGYIARTLAQAA
jgi:hypothetical protein